MNRKFFLWFCAFAIFIVAVWAGCSQYPVQQSIIISQPLERVALQFTKIQNWQYWHPVVKQISGSVTYQDINRKQKQIRLPDNDTYQIQIVNPAAILIEKRDKNGMHSSSLSAGPYLDGNRTLVTYQENMTGFEKIGGLFSHGNGDESNLLENLKAFAEDDKRSYGFFIQTVLVSDTLILTTSITTMPDSTLKAVAVLYNRLVSYCKQNCLLIKNYYYTSTVVLANDEVQVSVGMPVPKQSDKKSPEFEFLRLPANGRLVVGKYKGRYKDKQQLYSAMNEYIQDKRMKKVAQPLEQYSVANAPYHDTNMISMQVYYPVF